MPSWPTSESSRPRNPAIQPFSGSVGAVRFPQTTTPKMPSQKNSQDWNFSASWPSSGVRKARHMIPNTVPMKEEVAESPMAGPASPRWARGNPSRVAAALAGVPGMFNRMEERLPPVMAPTYTHSRMMMAYLGSIPKVRPVSRAIPMVAVRPGSMPTMVPTNVAQNTWNRTMGVSRFQISTRM